MFILYLPKCYDFTCLKIVLWQFWKSIKMPKFTHLMETSKLHCGRNAPRSLFKPKYTFLGCKGESQIAIELQVCLVSFYRFFYLLSRYFCILVSCLHMIRNNSPLVVAIIGNLCLLPDHLVTDFHWMNGGKLFSVGWETGNLVCLGFLFVDFWMPVN